MSRTHLYYSTDTRDAAAIELALFVGVLFLEF